MIDNINPHSIANEIRMKRTQHQGAFLIVEGDSDARFYKRFVAGECRIVPAYSKTNAIQALEILEQHGFPGVLAVVDADFWHLEAMLPDSQCLLVTDSHDTETMIVESPALEKVLDEFGSEKKIRAFTEKFGKTIRGVLLEGGVLIGYLRWISINTALALRFEGLSFGSFVKADTLVVDPQKLIVEVKNHSQRPDVLDQHLHNQIAALKNDDHNPWCVSCGHDLICILSVGLRKAIGSNSAADVKPEVLEKNLRLAYEYSYFVQTHLYLAIRDWEQAYPLFKVLQPIS